MLKMHSVYFDDYHPNWHISWRETSTYILILVTDGQLLYKLNDNKETLSKGDVVLISPGTFRAGIRGAHPPHQKYSFHFSLDSPGDKSAAEIAASPLVSNKQYIIFKPRNLEYLKQRFNLLHHVWKTKAPFFECRGAGIAMELFGSVMQEYTQISIPHHKILIANKIEQYINNHFREDIQVDELARLVSLTPNYVSTIFKEVTGLTIVQYIHQLRMETARDLLQHSDMSIAQISNYLGFCDPSYFNRVFKKITGQPPSRLRASLRNHRQAFQNKEAVILRMN